MNNSRLVKAPADRGHADCCCCQVEQYCWASRLSDNDMEKKKNKLRSCEPVSSGHVLQ